MTPRPKHPSDLAEGGLHVGNRAERPGADDVVDRVILEWEGLTIEPDEFHGQPALGDATPGHLPADGRRVDGQHPLHLGRVVGEVRPRSESHLQHGARNPFERSTPELAHRGVAEHQVDGAGQYMVLVDTHQRSLPHRPSRASERPGNIDTVAATVGASMKVLLIVNASASSVTARRQVLVHRLLNAMSEVRMVETNRRGHATQFAIDASRQGFDAVVVLGGDGTLNEAANGLVGTDCALAALPGGSTNVFARTLGLSDDPVEAIQANIDALEAGSIRRIGLGSVNGRYFLFHTGIGWDARLVRQVEKRSELKRYLGHPLFIWSGLETWFKLYDRTKPHFRVTYEDGTVVKDGYFSVVMNSNPYTYVGPRPFNLSPDVTLDSPLAAVTLTQMATRPFVKLMLGTLRSVHALKSNPIIDYRSDVHRLTIDADTPVPYQVDGDDLGDTTHLDFVYHAAAMNLVVPLDSGI